jgi:hypothetical protein
VGKVHELSTTDKVLLEDIFANDISKDGMLTLEEFSLPVDSVVLTGTHQEL